MESTVVAQGTVTEGDYVRAQYLHMRPRRAFAVVGVLLLAAALWAMYVAPSWILGVGLGAIVVSLGISLPWLAKRTYRQYKALHLPVTIELRSDGLYFRRSHGEGLVPWDHVVKWRCNSRLVLIYPANRLFYLVPAHLFTSPQGFENFVVELTERVGSAT